VYLAPDYKSDTGVCNILGQDWWWRYCIRSAILVELLIELGYILTDILVVAPLIPISVLLPLPRM